MGKVLDHSRVVGSQVEKGLCLLVKNGDRRCLGIGRAGFSRLDWGGKARVGWVPAFADHRAREGWLGSWNGV